MLTTYNENGPVLYGGPRAVAVQYLVLLGRYKPND